MKSLALFCLIVAVAAIVPDRTEELATLAKENVKKCQLINDLQPELLPKLHKAQDLAVVEATENVKCFIKCIYDSSPVTEDSQLEKNLYLPVAASHGMDRVLTSMRFEVCSRKYRTSPGCDDLWQMHLCFAGLEDKV